MYSLLRKKAISLRNPDGHKESPAGGEGSYRAGGEKGAFLFVFGKIMISQSAQTVKGSIDGRKLESYNHSVAGNGSKQGEQYAMVEPAGRKEGR